MFKKEIKTHNHSLTLPLYHHQVCVCLWMNRALRFYKLMVSTPTIMYINGMVNKTPLQHITVAQEPINCADVEHYGESSGSLDDPEV